MDESWRIPIGSLVPRRRSTEQPPRRHRSRHGALDPDDFRDVFGGPPLALLRNYYCGGDKEEDEVLQRSISWLEFRNSEPDVPAWIEERRMRRWPAIKTEEGFYDDIFGSERRDGGGGGRGSDQRSRTRSSVSKSNSSSVLSVEDFSPRGGGLSFSSSTAGAVVAVPDDPALSTFASKLRPITIPSRHNSPSPTWISGGEDAGRIQRTPDSTSGIAWPNPSVSNFRFAAIEEKRPAADTSRRHSLRYSSPEVEIISISTNSIWSANKVPAPHIYDSDDSSPSSSSMASSSFGSTAYRRVPERRNMSTAHRRALEELERAVVIDLDDEDEDEEENSYVIEIKGLPMGRREVEEEGAAAVDEAIAWAREKFMIHISGSSKAEEKSDEH